MAEPRGGLRVGGIALCAAYVALTLPFYKVLFSSAFMRYSLVLLGVLLVAFVGVARAGRGARSALLAPSPRAFALGAAALSAAISAWMAFGPLDDHTLALDGSVYLLEARALSHGHFGAMPPEPGLFASARFLFAGPDGALYGVFPPGYPLFLAPFALLGLPMLAGPAAAFGLTLAQYALGREATDDELASRLGVVLSLPSFARAIETSDLLSHAFVAALSAASIAACLRLAKKPSPALAALVGAACGWALSARLLDGLLLGAFVAGLLGWAVARRGASPRLLAWALLAALPFVALVFVEQKAATGSWLTPTQSEYFVRSDHPSTCHRLGFGVDVGCAVEHPGDREMNGPDGYTLGDAARVVSERAVVLGLDLAGFPVLLLLGFVGLARKPSPGDLLLGGFVVALAVIYGLFYYGNAPLYGARHLFPAAPFAWALMGRFASGLEATSGGLDRERLQGGVALAFVVCAVVTQLERWRSGVSECRRVQGPRADIRAVMDRAPRPSIVATEDIFGFLGGFDPVKDGPDRLLVIEDWAGLVEARRAHPGAPVFHLGINGKLEPLPAPPPAPGLTIELEQEWPSYQRPHGLAARKISPQKQLQLPASGDSALGIFVAQPGGSIELPFPVVTPGDYALWLEGYVGPAFGDYEADVDGHPLPRWAGGAPKFEARSGERSPPIALAKGWHVLTLRCVGRDPRAGGYLAAFDRLVGEPASP